MWSVDSRQIGKKIVLEAQIECLVRNLHIIPVLGGIKLLEVHLSQEFGLEQWQKMMDKVRPKIDLMIGIE